MINSYRKKFIFTTMISLFVIIAIMIGLTNIINYIKTCKDSDLTIETIVNKGGVFGPPGEMMPDGGMPHGFDREEAFRTRYFYVTFDENNNVVESNTDSINLNYEQAVEMAKTVLNKNSSKGFYDQYRFNIIEQNNGTQVFLLDCAKERMSNNAFLVTSLIISLVAYAVVFILMVIVSKIVVSKISARLIKRHKKELSLTNSENIDCFLMYDADVQSVVDNLLTCEEKLLLSRPCIEVWFLAHSKKVPAKDFLAKNVLICLRKRVHGLIIKKGNFL